MFSQVSVCNGGEVYTPTRGRHPPPGQTHMGRHLPWQTAHPKQTATAVDGMYQTEMHSCCLLFIVPYRTLRPVKLLSR